GVLPGMQSSEAHGISNAGEVVGISTFTSLPSKETPFTVVTRIRKAFLYTDAAKMRDLNALVVPGSPKLVDAQAINDAHQIAGTAEIGGREHAVLLSLCGNGIVESNGGNECDDGSFNGTPGSCCTTSCTRKPMGTVCETDNDKCTGVATCTAMGQCLQTTPDCRFGVSGIPNDSDPCHENPCDPVAGCQSRNIVPCDAAGSTKAFVGGASSVCSGGTIVGTSCALKASNVTLTVPANALPTPVNINAVRLPTSPCVDPRFFPGSFTLFAQETPMEGGRSVIVSGTRFFPASQSFALPVTMQFDWTNPVLTCSAPFDCTVGGAATGQTLEKNLTVDYRRPGSPAPTSLTPPCHTTAGCVSPPPAGYACLVDDVCCKTAGTCTAADTTCDPTLNSWKLNNVRHF
ncbi:MAG TPA: hypothetical protein VKA21_03190, partial [Candidatus Binatia bacterium]|nr:hypothetical protein [Candidatus Binatia bacterium]